MKIFKKKRKKFNQKDYDLLFHNVEYNLRELGFGDVSVNKKMKDFNKILYDILLKIEIDDSIKTFKINALLVLKYFKELDNKKSEKFAFFQGYFESFHNFCFGLPIENMVVNSIKFKY
jgi:cytochrome b pre-mRNA-processing protein 3